MLPYTCELCGLGVDPQQSGVWRKVVGWVQVGKTAMSRQDGPPMAYAHHTCMELDQRGLLHQQSML